MAVPESVSVLIVGGGVCGVLAGQRCAAKGLSYRIVDKGTDFGGTWLSLANAHSQLQVSGQSKLHTCERTTEIAVTCSHFTGSSVQSTFVHFPRHPAMSYSQ